ncbi:hypothetical protein Acr_04g0002720 [Actinidia rufa]|uniref:Uncharacterized protein n=1 Tax=Actinidia rufa TaxID=165716 RepID=A0A7J0EGD0_9ERIC|nr:hypothetical protein Acr_04g0002720 [Actinidia rufa]
MTTTAQIEAEPEPRQNQMREHTMAWVVGVLSDLRKAKSGRGPMIPRRKMVAGGCAAVRVQVQGQGQGDGWTDCGDGWSGGCTEAGLLAVGWTETGLHRGLHSGCTEDWAAVGLHRGVNKRGCCWPATEDVAAQRTWARGLHRGVVWWLLAGLGLGCTGGAAQRRPVAVLVAVGLGFGLPCKQCGG